jgi:hypothetical protein
MSNRHELLADAVIDSFKKTLDEATLAAISDMRFDELRGLIRQALSEELRAVAERLEATVRELRSELETPELEL